VNYTIDQPLKFLRKQELRITVINPNTPNIVARMIFTSDVSFFTITKYNGPPVENTPEKKPPRIQKNFILDYLYFFIGQYIM
jgi:hypothetical protein